MHDLARQCQLLEDLSVSNQTGMVRAQSYLLIEVDLQAMEPMLVTLCSWVSQSLPDIERPIANLLQGCRARRQQAAVKICHASRRKQS